MIEIPPLDSDSRKNQGIEFRHKDRKVPISSAANDLSFSANMAREKPPLVPSHDSAALHDNRARVRAVYAGYLIELLEESGVKPSQILRATGLRSSDFATSNGDSPRMITFAQQLQVYQNAVAYYRHDDLGIRLGERIKISDHGVFGYAIQSSRNLSQALRVMVRFVAVAGPLFDFALDVDDSCARLTLYEITPLGPVLPVAVDEVLTVIANQVLAQTDPVTLAQSVRIPYKSANTSHLKRLFGCEPSYESGFAEVRVRLEDLDNPFQLSDEETAKLCEARCAELLARLGKDDDIIDAVRRMLVQDLQHYDSIGMIAPELHLSERTLRRRLADSNTSFRRVRDEVRYSLALDYLQDTTLSNDEIAELLGYADTPNFYRAFKRWSGETPADKRRKQ